MSRAGRSSSGCARLSGLSLRAPDTGFSSSSHDASERPITGPALDRASAAALDHVGGGKVTGTEVGDEESLYEVEVTRDGGAVDVQLDGKFNVVSQKNDEEESGEQ